MNIFMRIKYTAPTLILICELLFPWGPNSLFWTPFTSPFTHIMLRTRQKVPIWFPFHSKFGPHFGEFRCFHLHGEAVIQVHNNITTGWWGWEARKETRRGKYFSFFTSLLSRTFFLFHFFDFKKYQNQQIMSSWVSWHPCLFHFTILQQQACPWGWNSD